MRKPRVLPLLLAVWMLCLTVCPTAAAGSSQSAKATTMQLMKTEGTVNVTNASGRSLTKRDNMLLYNGYHVETKAKSYAWINLDSSKLVKLDAVSEAEVRKSGKSLELLLNSGSFFFNVTSPLKEGETLNIRTTTMVVGIRGTSGWFKAVDRWSTEIYVLEGTVQCSVSDPVTGQAKEATIQSGEMAVATAYPQDYEGDKCDIVQERFEPGDIDGFVLEELAQNPELCADIFTKSGLDVMGAVEATQERRERDEQKMQEALDRIEDQLIGQDNDTSAGTVWDREDPVSTPSDSSTGDSSGGNVTERPSTGGQHAAGNKHPDAITLKGWADANEVQQALRQVAKNGVVLLEPNGGQSQPKLDINIKMTVPEGVTLEIGESVDVTIQERSSLTVDGSIVYFQEITNNGALTNNGEITASITGSGKLENSGTITGNISVLDGGTFTMKDGTINGNVSVSANGIFNWEKGKITGDIPKDDGSLPPENGETAGGDPPQTETPSSGEPIEPGDEPSQDEVPSPDGSGGGDSSPGMNGETAGGERTDPDAG